MSATASRIALGVPAHPGTAPSPAASDSAATEGTRLLPRRDHGGRFAPRATFPCCEACEWTLAESLAGETYCAHKQCGKYRETVGTVPGVNAGTVTAEALAVGT